MIQVISFKYLAIARGYCEVARVKTIIDISRIKKTRTVARVKTIIDISRIKNRFKTSLTFIKINAVVLRKKFISGKGSQRGTYNQRI